MTDSTGVMVPGYESVFGLVERPFSLAPDPRWFFPEGSHGRALDAILTGLGRRESLLLITGDLGVGKTLLGRTLASRLQAVSPVSFLANPLLTPDSLLRLLWDDFGGVPPDAPGATTDPRYLSRLLRGGTGGVLIVDDAHRLPEAARDVLLDLATPEPGSSGVLQVILLAQPPANAPLTLGGVDDLVRTRARLVPLTRDECGAYIAHRLQQAGANTTPAFSSRAVDVLFGLSNGLPRLVNLVCERALQEAAARGQQTIEPGHIAAAASELKLTRARPRRFRWFSRKIS